MIVFYAQGGLGNQLFQYATARRLALRNRCSLVVDHHWFLNPRSGETRRSLELSRYPVAVRLAKPHELMCWAPMRARIGRYLKPVLPLHMLRERGCGVNKEVLSAPRNSYLFGYWQSEAYFADIREQLLVELNPVVSAGEEDVRILELIQKSTSVSVHVRRGDYVSSASTAAYHGVCTLDYYDRALEYLSERVVNPTLFVFSDDPDWAKSNLRYRFPAYYIDHNTAGEAFQDLRLMSACQHHVLANSSFSWWGAWLSRSVDGLVIAPRRWYAVDRSTADLLPSRWIVI